MKDEALKLVLEVLQINLKLLEKINPYKGQEDLLSDSRDLTHKAITASKQALALDKKAENARELGLDYEPNYKVTVVDDQHPKGVPLEQWGRPAPEQEPVAWLVCSVNSDGSLSLEHAATWKEMAHEHISDAILDHGIECAKEWVVRPAYITPPEAQRQRVVFPTMLRKMWSGGEVQEWLDENVNKEKNT